MSREMSPLDVVECAVESIRLDRERFSGFWAITQDVALEVNLDWIADQIVVQMTGSMMALRAEKPLEIPLNWWQMLKDQHFGRWKWGRKFLKRWPVLMRLFVAVEYLPAVPLPESHRQHSWVAWQPERVNYWHGG